MIFKVLEGLKPGDRIRCLKWDGAMFKPGKIYTVAVDRGGLLGCQTEHANYFTGEPWTVEPFELVENSLFALLLPDSQP